MDLDYSAGLVLNETRKIITELKNQLVNEEHKLNQLEAFTVDTVNYNDANDYNSPAWFDSK